MNDNEEIKEVVNRLSEALDNLDKIIADLSKSINRMISLCTLILLVIFTIIVVALVL